AFPCQCGWPIVFGPFPCLIIFGTPTAAGWMQATSFFPNTAPGIATSSLKGTQKDLAAQVVAAVSKILGILAAPLWSMVMVVDLHVSTVEPTAPAGADPLARMLWAGQEWPFPRQGAEVLRSIFTSYLPRLSNVDRGEQIRGQ
ncbi:unnamed protein product, partial [Effrenium voratum]